MMTDALMDIALTTITGEDKSLADYPARAWLIVNTASRCGFTSQYQGLEALWQRYRDRGLVVMGFPCNQFGEQEPGDEQAIEQFCSLNFGVSFPMFAKIDVKGDNAHALFQALTARAPGLLGSRAIKWNFTKFLLNANGDVERFAPLTKPEALQARIERQLA